MWEQTERPYQLTTPLGKDTLLLRKFSGREAVSELFQFEFDVVAEIQTDVSFDALLGQKVTLSINRESGKRYINGIVRRVKQGGRDLVFKGYRLEVVPQLWLLTKNRRSKLFQQMTIPDILKKVLTGLDVSYELQGDWKSREYVCQYQESDFNFACRLMEECGIYYFFKHSAGGHQMVLANTPGSHPEIPFTSTAIYEEMTDLFELAEDRVFVWAKGQEIRSPKYLVWDEHFQLPYKHLNADKSITDSVQVGKTSHKLSAGSSGAMELYEFPGEYSRHFDGINKSGGEQPDHIQWPFTENSRIVDIRMQQEAVGGLLIEGQSVNSAFTAGHTFELSKHFSDDSKYVLTSVEHEGRQPLRTGEPAYEYTNTFTAIPFALPYRPQRTTPIPSIRGVQLATVVGPPGEEIFPDKYSRVKVQFHWDREGKNDIDSSCWIRVATHWAGKQWGAIHIPRIGQEVIVSFEEGDVDHPIIVGSVYNADMMPPYTLPDNKTQSGIKSRSSKNGSPDNYNEIRMEDKKGSEEILVHAEKDLTVEVEHNRTTTIGFGKGPMTPGDDSLHVMNNLTEKIENQQTTEAVTKITIKCGQSSIVMDPTSITISSVMIKIDAQATLDEHAMMTTIKSDAITTIKGAMVMIN
ncbi:MAG TPA: type VI secretion system tip protein TssI/VgrG [Bryobacteraceae bacterium]|jgi:type VI secretion system secreted protein VgrG|nr:type VI secretion system tip protein TssI/VgrG [Bryobacteraceae bacterium]